MVFAQAQAQTSYTEETAKLLEQVNLKTIDGREMAEVPLKLVLQLAIDRSVSLQISSLGNQEALHAVTAAKERNTPSLTTSFGYSNNPSFTSQLSGSSTSSSSFSSGYSLKTDSGLTYGLTYAEKNTGKVLHFYISAFQNSDLKKEGPETPPGADRSTFTFA